MPARDARPASRPFVRVAGLLLAALAATQASASAGVRLLVGPTPIPRGNAHAARDITVINQHLAFALVIRRRKAACKILSKGLREIVDLARIEHAQHGEVDSSVCVDRTGAPDPLIANMTGA